MMATGVATWLASGRLAELPTDEPRFDDRSSPPDCRDRAAFLLEGSRISAKS